MANTPLRSTLDSLANNFASAVLDAIRGASLQDLLAESGGASRRGPGRPRGSKTTATAARASSPGKTKGDRLQRRTPEDISRVLGLVVAAVKAKPMRAEEIQKFLKLDRRELPRVLGAGLKAKRLKKKGEKRATTYSAG